MSRPPLVSPPSPQLLADVSTAAEPPRRGGEPMHHPAAVLTLVAHPQLARVGERRVLEDLLAGQEWVLSRNAPDFTPASSAFGAPLGDPFLSRKPFLRFNRTQTGIRVSVGPETRCTSDGVPLRDSREWDLEAVRSGVPLELAGRLVLLLHLCEPGPSTALASPGMVGESVGLRRVRKDIQRVADLDLCVLIRGETGTGKELVAQALHQQGPRARKPFLSINLGAIPRELAAAELFGAAKGAFTGANQARDGFFRAAQGGTLFLDEIGEASAELQVMLLRVLETGELFPVGASTPVRTDVRLVAATDADLETHIRDGRFKAPLLHRLAGYEIQLPPLRERREDIAPLFLHFAREALESIGESHRLTPGDPYQEPWLPPALAVRLLRHSWPGNIRQLRNVARQLVVGSRGQSQLELGPRLAQELESPLPLARPPAPASPDAEPLTRRKSTEVTEPELLEALRAHEWDVKRAADHLGIPRSSIYNLIERSPVIRLAGDLSVEELTRCFHECQGDLDTMVRRLEVSRRALSRRIKELGLG
ncbi:sigma-54 dependent transcriptional regulator [Myxococcus sp. MISCRS1]|uniref:sigma-54 dependent transcriptional regulator n=1 Tax=Myxococcus sp. MISCRS1 TaxID=2996786 RepID=UPI002D1E4031|nr:sigma-54 dependent transcriptional regulator [Myxococcus sp. MISCRS1]